MTINTNLEFSRRVGIFYDEQMPTAIHQIYLLLFDGQSNMVRDSHMKPTG